MDYPVDTTTGDPQSQGKKSETTTIPTKILKGRMKMDEQTEKTLPHCFCPVCNENTRRKLYPEEYRTPEAKPEPKPLFMPTWVASA